MGGTDVPAAVRRQHHRQARLATGSGHRGAGPNLSARGSRTLSSWRSRANRICPLERSSLLALALHGFSDRRDDIPLLLRCQFRINRQRQYFHRGGIGVREVIELHAQAREAFLTMKRYGVVDFRGNTAGREIRAESIALGDADDELMVNVRSV